MFMKPGSGSCFETQSLPLAPSLLPSQLYLLSRKSLSLILAFLINAFLDSWLPD